MGWKRVGKQSTKKSIQFSLMKLTKILEKWEAPEERWRELSEASMRSSLTYSFSTWSIFLVSAMCPLLSILSLQQDYKK